MALPACSGVLIGWIKSKNLMSCVCPFNIGSFGIKQTDVSLHLLPVILRYAGGLWGMHTDIELL